MDTYRTSDIVTENKKSALRNIWRNIKKNKEHFIALFSVIMVISFVILLINFQPELLAYWVSYFMMFGIIYIFYDIFAQILFMMTEDPDCNDYNVSSKRHQALCNKYKVWYALND